MRTHNAIILYFSVVDFRRLIFLPENYEWRQFNRVHLKYSDIPNDAIITNVWYTPKLYGGSFGFRLEHPSFPEVPGSGFPEVRRFQRESFEEKNDALSCNNSLH